MVHSSGRRAHQVHSVRVYCHNVHGATCAHGEQFVLMDTFTPAAERAEQLGISNAEAARRCGLEERRYGHYARPARTRPCYPGADRDHTRHDAQLATGAGCGRRASVCALGARPADHRGQRHDRQGAADVRGSRRRRWQERRNDRGGLPARYRRASTARSGIRTDGQWRDPRRRTAGRRIAEPAALMSRSLHRRTCRASFRARLPVRPNESNAHSVTLRGDWKPFCHPSSRCWREDTP